MNKFCSVGALLIRESTSFVPRGWHEPHAVSLQRAVGRSCIELRLEDEALGTFGAPGLASLKGLAHPDPASTKHG